MERKLQLKARSLRNLALSRRSCQLVDQGRVEVTLYVEYPLVQHEDVKLLKGIKKMLTEAGGTIGPRPTKKPGHLKASVPWFQPELLSSDEDE